MDLGIVGLIDIIFLVLLVVTIIVGYKKGFMKKIISLFGLLVVIAFSVMFASGFAQLLKSMGLIYPNLEVGITERLGNVYDESVTELPTYSMMLEKAYNIPAFFATLLAWLMGNPVLQITSEHSTAYLAIMGQAPQKIAMSLLIVISFLIIFVFSWLVLFILRIIANSLRESKFVRVVDGILGILLAVTLYLVSFVSFLFVLKLIRDNANLEWFNNFIDKDLKLTDNSFRICKGLYNSNIFEQIKNFFTGFFK